VLTSKVFLSVKSAQANPGLSCGLKETGKRFLDHLPRIGIWSGLCLPFLKMLLHLSSFNEGFTSSSMAYFASKRKVRGPQATRFERICEYMGFHNGILDATSDAHTTNRCHVVCCVATEVAVEIRMYLEQYRRVPLRACSKASTAATGVQPTVQQVVRSGAAWPSRSSSSISGASAALVQWAICCRRAPSVSCSAMISSSLFSCSAFV
jgi:hypothetical protein